MKSIMLHIQHSLDNAAELQTIMALLTPLSRQYYLTLNYALSQDQMMGAVALFDPDKPLVFLPAPQATVGANMTMIAHMQMGAINAAGVHSAL